MLTNTALQTFINELKLLCLICVEKVRDELLQSKTNELVSPLSF